MKKISIAFIALMLIALAAPIARFNAAGTVSKKENRTLAVRPFLIKDGRVNPDLSAEYSAWLSDRFGGRQRLISLDKRIEYDVLRANIFNERALRGKDGWWFYTSKADGDNLSDFFKVNLLGDAERAAFRRRVAQTAGWCRAQGISCLFVIGPNKHSVYPEHYPFPRPNGITRADQITAVFDELGVPYIFPRDAIIAKKPDYDVPLYYETDTHWNPLGASIAFAQIFDTLRAAFPRVDFPQVQYTARISYSDTAGDILPMLGIEKSRSTRPDFVPSVGTNADLYTYLKNDGRDGVHTRGAAPTLPRALIYRDSFCSALEPFLSPLFSEAEYHWKRFGEEDKEHVLEYKPDVIIFETVERGAPGIVQ